MENELINTGQPRTVRECLLEARNSTSPAETVKHLFLAVSYQQQQIEQLELALGAGDARALEGIRGRAGRLQHEDLTNNLGLT